MLPELLSQIPPDQEIGSVTADGACDTRKCHDAIAERGARRHSAAQKTPSRGRLPHPNITAGARSPVLEPVAVRSAPRNEALRASKDLGRALWRRWSGYHRRSRAETKMRLP